MQRKFWLKAAVIAGIILMAGAAAWYFFWKKAPVKAAAAAAAPSLQPTFEMRQVSGHAVPFQNKLPYPTSETQQRETLSLNGTWKKMRSPGSHDLSLAERTPNNVGLLKRENPEAVDPAFDDQAWQSGTVPGVENPSPDRYMDVTWYRRSFKPPPSFSAKRALLEFGAANYVADVWVNGEWIGCHEGGFTPFVFDVTSRLKSDAANIVTVRVDNIPWIAHKPETDKSAPASRSDIVPYKTADWWNYGGLLRDVTLTALEPVAIFRTDVRPTTTGLDVLVVTGNVTEKKMPAEFQFKVYPAKITEHNLSSRSARDIADLENPIAVQATSKSADGLTGQPFDAHEFSLLCSGLEPWELRKPKLYVLETAVMQDGKAVDTFYTQFGIRTVSADNTRFLLNGRPTFLRGVAAHETFPGSDKNLPPEIERVLHADFQNMYDLNANFVRTGHRPAHPLTLLMADRLGIGIWEEIPVYWFGAQELDYQRTQRPVARQMFLEMIARDINRPSVLVWGACNECGAQKERADFIRDLREHGRKLDPTRLIAQSECDFSGFTSYYGVFYGHNYGDATVKALEAMRAANPEKVLMATEFGIWSERDLSNSDNQIKVARETYAALTKKPYMIGTIWWALNDWHTMITDPQTMGLITFTGKKKPAYYVLQELYAAREGRAFLKWYSPLKERPIRGPVDVELEMVSPSPFKSLTVQLDGVPLPVDKISQEGRFKFNFDSNRLAEGDHTLFTRAENQAGTVLSQERTLFIDNMDEVPVVMVNLKSGNTVMDEQILHVDATDDRGVQKLQVNVDDQPWRTVEPLYAPGIFIQTLNLDASKPDNAHKVHVKLTDSGGQSVELVLALNLASKGHGQYLDLPFNKDWISESSKLDDGTGWDFPAEELPLSNKPFIFNSRSGPVSFRFPDKAAGAKNCVECQGQKIPIPPGSYRAIHILAAMHDGSSPVAFQVAYEKGLPRTVMLNFSDWWRADPIYGEETVVKTAFHHEKNDVQKPPGVGIYLNSIPLEGTPVSLTLPNDGRLRIFAITLEKEERQ
jgi:glycosyl hydrolase family 2